MTSAVQDRQVGHETLLGSWIMRLNARGRPRFDEKPDRASEGQTEGLEGLAPLWRCKVFQWPKMFGIVSI